MQALIDGVMVIGDSKIHGVKTGAQKFQVLISMSGRVARIGSRNCPHSDLSGFARFSDDGGEIMRNWVELRTER